MHPTESTDFTSHKITNGFFAVVADSPFASLRRNMRQSGSIMSPCIQASNFKLQTSRPLNSRGGVTVVEVLFAMFVILFGLVGLAAIIPMAARQANDSYQMVQASAAIDNIAATLVSEDTLKPSLNRPWWLSDDTGENLVSSSYAANSPIPRLGPGDHGGVREYRTINSLDQMYDFLRGLTSRAVDPGTAAVPRPGDPYRIEVAKREAYAQSFCIDPLFCADQSRNGWRYAVLYGNYHLASDQLGFRRSRMPFVNETISYTGGTGYSTTATFAPRMMRVTWGAPGAVNTSGPPTYIYGDPISKATAQQLASSLGDTIQAEFQEDKSFGALRQFATGQVTNNSGVTSTVQLAGGSSSQMSWLATLSPSESTSRGQRPTDFELSIVVFANRDRNFDALVPSIAGSETYPVGERMALATSQYDALGTVPFPALVFNQFGDLPFSNGGSMNLRLWAPNGDTSASPIVPPVPASVRVGDWILLSRRIDLGNDQLAQVGAATIDSVENFTQVIHRHRWYRVTGVDNRDAWPRDVRVAGEVWDYPELTGYSTIPTTPVNSPNLALPVTNGYTRIGTLQGIATTATVFRNITTVLSKQIRISE